MIDGTIHLSEYKMNVVSGINSTWLEYINQNPEVLVKTIYSYTLTEEQMSSGPLYPSGTYTQYAIVKKNNTNEFQIADNSLPQ